MIVTSKLESVQALSDGKFFIRQRHGSSNDGALIMIGRTKDYPPGEAHCDLGEKQPGHVSEN